MSFILNLSTAELNSFLAHYFSPEKRAELCADLPQVLQQKVLGGTMPKEERLVSQS